MPLADYNAKVDRLLQDDAGHLSSAEIDGFCADALEIYSKDVPYVKVADITGTGAYQYSLPNDWKEGFSIIKSLEYPAGEQVPVYLDSDEYTIYKTASALKLHLYGYTPSASETMRLTYTTLHSFGAQSDTVYPGDVEALAKLAASLCCDALARVYAQSSAPDIGAGAVSYQNKSSDYAKRAKELLDQYNSHIGKEDGKPKAASSTASWDTGYSWGGDWLTHRERS